MGQMGWALIGPSLDFHGDASAASLAKECDPKFGSVHSSCSFVMAA